MRPLSFTRLFIRYSELRQRAMFGVLRDRDYDRIANMERLLICQWNRIDAVSAQARDRNHYRSL